MHFRGLAQGSIQVHNRLREFPPDRVHWSHGRSDVFLAPPETPTERAATVSVDSVFKCSGNTANTPWCVTVNRPPLPSDVTRILEQWRPAHWSERDLEVLESLLPTVREWVTAAGPANGERARRFLRAAAGIAVWAYRELNTTDPALVLHPNNVEHWSMTIKSDRSARWREATRGVLRTLGRAVNPDDWPRPTRKVGKQTITRPYTATEEAEYRFAANLPGWANRSKRLWVVSAALGAGLRGPEIAVARTGDLRDIHGGRLAVHVRGPYPRLTPIRRDYTTLAREAADGSPTDRFIPTDGRNAVHSVAGQLDPGDGQCLVLRRARSTWLVAHMVAGTPLAALRQVAGPLSANTLDGLLRYTTDNLDDNTAVMEALQA